MTSENKFPEFETQKNTKHIGMSIGCLAQTHLPSSQPDGFSRCEKHMRLTSIFDIPSTWPPAFGRVLSSSGSPNFGRVHFDSWWRGEVGTSVSACAAPFVLFHTSPMMTKCWKNSELKHSTFPHHRTILSGFHWHCFVFTHLLDQHWRQSLVTWFQKYHSWKQTERNHWRAVSVSCMDYKCWWFGKSQTTTWYV